MKKSETTKCMQIVFDCYNNFLEEEKVNALIDIWHECLKDLEYRDVEPAIYELIKTSKCMPTIAEIRKKSGNIRRLPDGTYIKDGLHYMN